MKYDKQIIFQVALTPGQFEEFKFAVIKGLKDVKKEQNEQFREAFFKFLKEAENKRKGFFEKLDDKIKEEDQFLKEDAKKLIKILVGKTD